MKVEGWLKGLAAGLALLTSGVPARSQNGPVMLLPPVDSVPAAAPANVNAPLSLDQVIATVLTADPRLRVGYEEVNQAVADAMTASLRPNPIFSPDGQLLPMRKITPIQQGGPPQIDAIVSYPIDWFLFGKRRAAMASASLGVRQTESEYYDLIRTRIRDASLLTFDVMELKALRDLAVQDVESLARVEAITKKAVETGGRPAVDANRIRLDLLRSQQFLRDAETLLTSAKARLKAFLGRTDADPGFDIVGSLDLPPTPPTMSTDEAVALAQENRPDLAALRFKVDKAQADTLVEKRKAYPQVVARTGYSRQFQNSIGYRDIDLYMFGMDLSLPIFDRNQGNRAKAASQLAQAQYEVQQSQVDLRAEIEQVLNEYRMALLSARAVAQEQLKLAEQVRDAINKANEAGGRPLLDVLDAQRNFRETYRLYITSRANYWRASVRLSATLGKKVIP